MSQSNQLLPCETLGAPEPEDVVIWLHGLGASGHDFVPVVPMMQRPQTRFVFPHAPRRPVTINMGFVMPAWYDILHMEERPNREPADQVLEATTQVHALIEDQMAKGIPSEKIILGGFSQGGAMALHAGVRFPHTLGGIMVLSAYELRADAPQSEKLAANQETPMLFCHGTGDPVVPASRGRRAYEAYATPDRRCAWHDYPMAHEVCVEELSVIADWFRACLDG
ncbi:MAG: alpha/beta hydrolase [Bradymonadia bacterium]